MRYLKRFFLSLLLAGVPGGGVSAAELPRPENDNTGVQSLGSTETLSVSDSGPAMVAEEPVAEPDGHAGEEGTEALASVNPVWKSINDSRREQASGTADSVSEDGDNAEDSVAAAVESGTITAPERELQEAAVEISASRIPETPDPEPSVPAPASSPAPDPAVAAPSDFRESGAPSAEEPAKDSGAGEAGFAGTAGADTAVSGADNERQSGSAPVPESSSAAVSDNDSSLESSVSGNVFGGAASDSGSAADPETASPDTPSGASSAADQSEAVRSEGEFVLPRFYSREYFENLFLPYFYHTYEVPQSLDNFFSLVDIHVAEDGTGLVMGINATDNVGPLDLDGPVQDNGHIRTFCLLALRLGVLHRTENIYLEFFHDTQNFFNKKISYSFCTGKSPVTAGKKILDSEEVRLDDEFVYAYEKEQGKLLSREYLRNAFAPYAFERMHESFVPEEGKPRMTVTDDGNLKVDFITAKGARETVRSSRFIEERIRRTCGNQTYRNWILPRIGEIRYYYRLSDGTPVKDIAVSSSVCSAAEVTALQ